MSPDDLKEGPPVAQQLHKGVMQLSLLSRSKSGRCHSLNSGGYFIRAWWGCGTDGHHRGLYVSARGIRGGLVPPVVPCEAPRGLLAFPCGDPAFPLATCLGRLASSFLQHRMPSERCYLLPLDKKAIRNSIAQIIIHLIRSKK